MSAKKVKNLNSSIALCRFGGIMKESYETFATLFVSNLKPLLNYLSLDLFLTYCCYYFSCTRSLYNILNTLLLGRDERRDSLHSHLFSLLTSDRVAA